jgi:hypothetical protein
MKLLFSAILAVADNRLYDNLKTTKSVFPEETTLIESGLDLMYKLTAISVDTCKEYPDNPNFYANHNLFARNRQLLLQAYICCLSSSYGTEFVILRTVLENNNLMRLFNKDPQYAFDWLPVMGNIFGNKARRKVKKDICRLYGQLCNYTHPNFMGWQEMVRLHGEVEVIEKLPAFSPITGETSVGLLLFIMQLTFKSYVQTFKNRLLPYATELQLWQAENIKLLTKLTPEG